MGFLWNISGTSMRKVWKVVIFSHEKQQENQLEPMIILATWLQIPKPE